MLHGWVAGGAKQTVNRPASSPWVTREVEVNQCIATATESGGRGAALCYGRSSAGTTCVGIKMVKDSGVARMHTAAHTYCTTQPPLH